MKVQTGHERPVKCGSCGKWAHEREVMVRSATHGRMVGYHSHDDNLHGTAHIARLQHISDFFEKLDALAASLTSQCTDGGALDRLPLAYGSIVAVDFAYQLPDACSDYTRANPLVEVRFNTKTVELMLPPITLATVDVNALIATIFERAAIRLNAMKAQFDVGKL